MNPIVQLFEQQKDTQAISIEQYQKRRIQRRRRVAKRLLKRFPLFAVEMMQNEFPGYTYEEFISDVTRKTKKGKKWRKPKTFRFDWGMLKERIPEFYNKCRERTPTKAVLKLVGKDGQTYRVSIIAKYENMDHGYSVHRLDTLTLIKLWEQGIKAFLSHPAMKIEIENNSFT